MILVPVIAASDPTPTGGDWLVARRLPPLSQLFCQKFFWRNFRISERFARGTRHTLNRMGVDGTIMPRLTGDDRFQHLHSLVCRAGHREDYCVETRCNEYRFWRQNRPRARTVREVFSGHRVSSLSPDEAQRAHQAGYQPSSADD
jgi:hypothetical protein